MIARIFPNIRVDRSHIVFRFSGVRPLPAHAGQNLKAKTTGQISRDHSIQVLDGVWTGLEFPVYSLVGGKWTSFRAFSELVTDKVLNFLGMTRQKDTKDLPIGGGRDFSRSLEEHRRYMDSICAWTGLPLERLQVLFERYGMRAQEIAMFIVKETDQPLKSIHDYSAREVAYLAQYEKVIHLDDLLLRRSKLAMLGLLTRTGINELADALGDALRWDTKIKKYQVTRAMKILADRHGVRL
jgi:glycerol-3-phosphate dehydrogenase